MKKGFTLIELMAVVIIISIVALIATPKILDIIEASKKSGANSRASMLLEGARDYYAENYFNSGFKGYDCTITNRSGCDKIVLNGEKPDSAVISIDKKGYINGSVTVGKYTFYICNGNLQETSECEPISNVTAVNRYTMKVLVITYNPVLTDGQTRAATYTHTDNIDSYIADLTRNYSEMSHGLVNIQIVGREEAEEFPTYKTKVKLTNGTQDYKLDAATYESMYPNGVWFGWWNRPIDASIKEKDGSFSFDYTYFMNKFNLVNRKNNGEFDQVWIIGPDPLSAYESAMIGRNAYWINGAAITANCDNFAVFGFTYSRPETGIECIYHSAENILGNVFATTGVQTSSTFVSNTRMVYDKDLITVTASNYDDLNLWQKFSLTEWFNGVKGTNLAGVGMAHFPPNATADYDFCNNTLVESTALDWENYPNLTGQTTKVNCQTWNPTGSSRQGDKFQIWAFSLMPHVAGRTKDGYSNSWWDYIYTLDYATNVSATLSNINTTKGSILAPSFSVQYQSGKTKRYTIEGNEENITIGDKNVINYTNGELTAINSGTTTLKYCMDGRCATANITISE